mmetsp:Transcript_121908/g.341254  ORF Transcript_121908/g.341254 Transcript_121908/m.341254 type:complete len:310 (-) Transcript_121908:145-1074(-)
MQDEHADAYCEHVEGLHLVARQLRAATHPHCALGQPNLIQIAICIGWVHLHHIASYAIRPLDLHLKLPVRPVYLRGPVVMLPADTEVPKASAVPRSAENCLPKVDKLELASALQQDVLQGDVAMPDIVSMQVRDCLQQLRYEQPHPVLAHPGGRHRHDVEKLRLAMLCGQPRVPRIPEATEQSQHGIAPAPAAQVCVRADLGKGILRVCRLGAVAPWELRTGIHALVVHPFHDDRHETAANLVYHFVELHLPMDCVRNAFDLLGRRRLPLVSHERLEEQQIGVPHVLWVRHFDSAAGRRSGAAGGAAAR